MIFNPRFNAPYETNPSENRYWWTSENPYYPKFQMPNCTAYAYGRLMEISILNNDWKPPSGFAGNGGTWGDYGYIGGTYPKGSTPKLGALAVWEEEGEAGHVGVVEQVNEDGSYICSNSGYYRPIDTTNWHYFFLTNCTKENIITYEGAVWGNYNFKWFLYPPYIDNPNPSIPIAKKSSFPWVIYASKLREKR